MTVPELLPALSELTLADKLRVLQHLAAEIADEHEARTLPPQTRPMPPQTTYPVWSPYPATEAADALLSALAAEQSSH